MSNDPPLSDKQLVKELRKSWRTKERDQYDYGPFAADRIGILLLRALDEKQLEALKLVVEYLKETGSHTKTGQVGKAISVLEKYIGDYE